MHLKINKLSNICFIFLFAFVFLLQVVLITHISQYKSFWADDFWFCRYSPLETFFHSLTFKDTGHGGGYIGLFLSKFLSFGLPSLLNLHPNDYLYCFVGIFEGIFTALLPMLFLKFSNIYNKSKYLYLLLYILLSICFLYYIFGSMTIVITYNWFRYIFSFVFFSIFWNYIYKILFIKDIKINKISIIFATICGYILGTSSEILFFLSVFLTVCIGFLKILKVSMNKLDIKFYIPVSSLYIAIICFMSSGGFKQVAVDRGIQNINLSWQVIKEFSQTFFQLYVVDCIWQWVALALLIVSCFIVAVKNKINLKNYIFPLLMLFGTILVIYSLILCGKTYDETTRDKFWLWHSNIICMYKILLFFPIIMLSDFLLSQMHKKVIPIISLLIIDILIFHNVMNPIVHYDCGFMRELKTNQYQYQKIIRFYNLKNQTAKVPDSLLEYYRTEFNSEVHKKMELYSMDMIYHDNLATSLGYIITNDTLANLYNDGLCFGDEELKELKFSKLKDNSFVLSSDCQK